MSLAEREVIRIKHSNREELKKRKRKILKAIIAGELVLLLAACYAVYCLAWHNIYMRRARASYEVVKEIKAEDLKGLVDYSLKVARERIVSEVDEYMWTTEEVVYRKGPDKSYKKGGKLDIDSMVHRTGLTKNEWSRVSINDKEYYIPSAKLTDEKPISALIEGGKKGEYQRYALSLFPDFDWSDRELEPLINLWNRESHWNPNSHNKRSGAHGIPQALPASKMSSEGSDYYTNGKTQIRWGLKYIYRRYGSPSAAWNYFLAHNSY